MMRRRHRKSRKGCLECKRRHIKCDETRPRCINCSTAERECPYPTTEDAGPGASPAEGTSPASPPLINMLHAELLHHFLTDSDMVYSLAVTIARDIVMSQALRGPYLLHQVLALSARHLAIVRPHAASFYHNTAIQLQTHALTMFNAIDVEDFENHRVPGFIFSAVLGFHALCDMLSYRDPDFQSALARFVGYVRLHRGVYSVMEGHWEEIRETELKPILEAGMKWYEMGGEGPECDDIRERIAGRTGELSEEERAAAGKAVGWVQCVMDGGVERTHMILSWGVMIQREFWGLIERGAPEAMVVLGYYFLALQRCRKVWMIGDAGEYLFGLVVAYVESLGGEWAEWMRRPRELMARFTIARPSPADAERIGEIHISAMMANPLLHAQFPTPESIVAMREFLSRYTAAQLESATSGVLVAMEQGTGTIVGFAKWDSPSHREEVKLESGELQDVPGCCREYLDGYVTLSEAAMRRCFGKRDCYRLSFVCVDPGHQGVGAGSRLTRRVLDMAAADGLPVYLESTENAVSMYERFGFREIDSFEMDLPGGPKYREVCMVLEPPPLKS
ncbi:acyl-CoA N-acyltransferase [Cercophora newfieldiana]|uniref:Acyl-CoA N-acyltransferase n=1 Tax=Cercophora newfieldiana TaxID=92897 RepID=A0AA39XVT1_9PEZI|nr:acyl-CoA N-acyltransferase [Cercophora newfieldiana]